LVVLLGDVDEWIGVERNDIMREIHRYSTPL
jgi:hypothetical protein